MVRLLPLRHRRGSPTGLILSTVAFSLVASLLGASGGAYWPVALFLVMLALLSVVAVLASPERFRSRIWEGVPAGGRALGAAG